MSNYGRNPCDILKRFDLFRREISLTYNGAEKFKTSFGVIMTSVLAVCFLIYFLDNVVNYYKDPIKSISTLPSFIDMDQLFSE